MRKVFGSLLFLTTFVLGWTLTLVFSLMSLPQGSDVEVIKEVPIAVTACELMDEDDYLHSYLQGKIITFPTTVYALSSGEMIANALNGDWCHFRKLDTLPFPAQLEVESNTELENLRDYLQRDQLEIDLQITGTAKIYFMEGRDQIYLVNPTDVKRLSPFRPFTRKGSGTE